MKWPEKNINLQGNILNSIAPLIISASRSTDIPAFYAEDFIRKLQSGYTYWRNPYNGKQSLISFSETKFIVFWTKNAIPMIPYLEYIDNKGINYYFNYTLNDYENEGLEPNLPGLNKRIDDFIGLSDKIGKEKTIWRFDPLILLNKQNDLILIDKITKIAKKIHKYTTKLVVSFVDTSYRKVRNNFLKYQFEIKEIDIEQKSDFITRLKETLSPFELEIYTCAEKEDLSKIPVKPNKCIDPDLIERLSNNIPELTDFISKLRKENQLKDKGQRKYCGCMVSKDIGNYLTCKYSCVYCYAGSSK